VRVLLFRDTSAALRFIRRHRDKVVQVLVIVDEDGKDPRKWKASIEGHYRAVVLSGLLLLSQES